jgi:TrmH family RNA methyltransferase
VTRLGPARIASLDNPAVKEALRLRQRRAREKSGRFLVEGAREIRRALDAGLSPVTLFVEEKLAGEPESAAESAARGARVLAVTPAVFSKIAIREAQGGLLGVFPVPRAAAEELRLPPEPLVLAASGIEKPGNVGALLRSADAFGADAFVAGGGTDLWNPNVVRASLGCLFTVRVAAVAERELIPWLKSRRLRVAAASPAGSTEPSAADLTGAVALLLGSEEAGLAADVRAACNLDLRIPMRGAADSLNVAVAAGILLYEADRQRSRRR